MKEFLDIIKNRKSIRSFLDRPIDPSLIKEIIALSTYAPTNCNQQLWNFIVVDDALIKERLIKEAASNTLVRKAPAIVVVTHDGWNYKEAIQGASLAVGHILLAAEYYGIGALPMNSYGADTKIKKILHIPDREVICCFVVLGYPDERAEKALAVQRRPVEEVIHWNRFQNKRKPPFTYNPNDWNLEDLQNHQKYYCRKTFSGKEMDIMSPFERDIVKLSLSDARGPITDLFSYDGSFLREFPDVRITAIDLTQETSDYTKAAIEISAEHKVQDTSYKIYDKQEKTFINGRSQTITCIYKLERLPNTIRENIFTQAYHTLPEGGTLLIIARKSNIFLSSFFLIIKLFLGKDVRKTGIYTFFGPYEPISLNRTLRQIKKSGFRDVSWSGYFIIPAFYEKAYQMLVQYIRSEGSSYLHREEKKDVISRTLSLIMKIQGLHKFGRLGSVVVIRCKK